METKRRDHKGRLLKTGESQRSDGRYAYKYIDANGKPKFIYSWKLVATDRIPAGKRACVALREKEAQIQKDLAEGLDSSGQTITLCQLYQLFIEQSLNVKTNTQTGRHYLMALLQRDVLGHRPIRKIKLSDGKAWAIRLSQAGYAYQTINNYKRSLKAAFYLAQQDDYVRKNPFDYPLRSVLKDTTVPKTALSVQQETDFLAFVAEDPIYQSYYDELVLLLKTGLRISEFCGLTINDVDLEQRIIDVNHQLLRNPKGGLYIESPKTACGVRKVPLSEVAYQAMKRVLATLSEGNQPIIDGYNGFLFFNQRGLPKTGDIYKELLKRIVRKYNKTHQEPLPAITPHTLRHTFCTRLASQNMNPKSLQYVMGHANIATTLDLYAHVSMEQIQADMMTFVS
ncbi:integrase DNA-binding domain-containing protein [Enterococcus sp. DIV1420a]|uniref:integrase DNA-binding domain-containing protein n=1 Tax=Enterococcus sp. DIV1420a TaxID=2774672 RepID=UPI003F28733E